MKVATCQERLNELFDADPRNDTAIANYLGVSKQTISMWRNGTRSPKKTVLLDIAKKYSVTIDWLMGFDVDPSNTRDELKEYVGSNSGFVKLVDYMSQEDYRLVLDAFRRAEAKMKEAENDQVHT